jgi:hypothetical protein
MQPAQPCGFIGEGTGHELTHHCIAFLAETPYAFRGPDSWLLILDKHEMTQVFLSTQIIHCPAEREELGLAMSSRNGLLSPEAHDTAAYLFRALTTAASCAEARGVLEAQGFRVEHVEERWARRLAAVNSEGVRYQLGFRRCDSAVNTSLIAKGWR